MNIEIIDYEEINTNDKYTEEIKEYEIKHLDKYYGEWCEIKDVEYAIEIDGKGYKVKYKQTTSATDEVDYLANSYELECLHLPDEIKHLEPQIEKKIKDWLYY